MSRKLPKRLRIQPIVDAVVEIRFSADLDASLLLPGLLVQKLGSGLKVEKLPLADMPEFVRQQQEELRFQPLVRVVDTNYLYLVGSNSLVVGCRVPYRGWEDFKGQVDLVCTILKDCGICKEILRYSIKYVDLLDYAAPNVIFANMLLSVEVAGVRATDYAFNVSVQVPDGDFLHAINIGAPANITFLTGETKAGTVVSVDTISLTPPRPYSEFYNNRHELLDGIHAINKQKFFDCLKDNALEVMGAEYD